MVLSKWIVHKNEQVGIFVRSKNNFSIHSFPLTCDDNYIIYGLHTSA